MDEEGDVTTNSTTTAPGGAVHDSTTVESSLTTTAPVSNSTVTREDDGETGQLDFIIGVIIGSIVVAVVAVILFLLVKKIRQKGRAPDQYELLKDDIKTIDATPSAKRAVRKPGVTSDTSLEESTRLWQSD